MSLRLGFIVVFHNAEEYVNRVLNGVVSCMDTEDVLLVVADGCTDSTAKECLQLIANLMHKNIFLQTSDLHEIGSLNEAFSEIKEFDPDYVIHVQGDMILDATTFPILRKQLTPSNRIGLVSFRMGGCAKYVDENLSISYTERSFGHNYKGKITKRQKVVLDECCIAGRGPLVISSELLIANSWKIDENLRPHSMDDVDLSLLALEMNLRNYSINLPYRSDVTWGATRNPNRSYQDSVDVSALKNLSYVIAKHSEFFAKCIQPHSHSRRQLAETRVGFTFLLGSIVNRELLNPKVNLSRRLRKKIAYLVSTKFQG